MEAHIKNLFKYGVNEYDRVNKTQGPNTLGISVFRQAYTSRTSSFFGIELSDKFFKAWVELGRPEIITYSRIQEDANGKPVQVKRANSVNIGFMHEEQGIILLFQNAEDAREAEQRLIELYPSLLSGDEPMIMSGTELETLVENPNFIDDFLNLYNLQNTNELGHRIVPQLEEMVFINAPPAIPGKGLYWTKSRPAAKNTTATVDEEVQVDEDVKF